MKKWAEEFGIDIYLDQKLETLSKGNQQKVQIAQSFICEPDILILDEPFSGLDPVNSKIFQDSLLNYIREARIIIFSSHHIVPFPGKRNCKALCHNADVGQPFFRLHS
ncbi:ATP-binding cassette domain-containing protein [Planococcus kocurii]|uniref:ATP-binding cassette domain-containing protein n=1 Tax=Planococcus kocurii TaxID=1374 RepID=UPI003D091550